MGIFKNHIKSEDKEILRDFFDSYDYMCSGASFSSLYMWRNINEFTWEIIGDYLCIEGLSHLELENGEQVHFMMPPMTATGHYESVKLKETIEKAREIFEKAGKSFTVRLVPEHMLDMMKAASPFMTYAEDRPNFDYIYETKKLMTFGGRALHSKKNHLNYFRKTYEYECVDLRPEMTDNIMEFIRRFNAAKDIPESEMKFLRMEEEAMEDVFRNIDELGCVGCAVLIDGSIEAIALGGLLGQDTVVEHIEKANTAFRGLYQQVLSEFCSRVKDRVEFINREEDMDLDNLREMKLSYKPVKLLKKYIGEITT
ncbi:MAG: phosphatidylglycerol lysyltransferase domain-containing protein [Bacillota bacterium]|nr:phosphatidylglycerol lysyltransferase domain-containing protein [Bacillota bacterium]